MEKVKLGDVCERGPSNIAQKDIINNDGVYPIYGASGIIKYVDFYTQENEYIAIVKDGAGIGRTMILPAKSSIIGTMQYIFPKKNIYVRYLYYAIKSMNLAKYYSGVTIPHIYFKDYQKEQLYLPGLDMQKKIVQKLDKIQEIIDIREKQLEQLDKLIKSQFVEMFGEATKNEKMFPVVNIGDRCFVTKLAGFEYSKYIDYKDSGDVIMVRGLNVKNQRLKLDDVYYIEQSVSDSLPRSQLKCGDICMTYVGINIGDVALVDNMNNYHLAPNVAKISINDINEINPQFFVYLLAYNKSNFASNATNTAKQALNMERIRKLSVMLPPIDLQNKFALIVEQIDKQKFEIQKSLEEMQLLQESLMNKYFG